MKHCIPRPSNRTPQAPVGKPPPYFARSAAYGIFIMAAFAASAPSSFGADVTRGRALYENHCEYCHTPKIHMRAKRLPATRDEVRLIVDDWRRQVNVAWTPEEVEDVVEYLNVTRYKFGPDR